jgi:ATP-dependent helicase/DNAse subunit B
MCSPANFSSLVKLIRRVNSELSILPRKERVKRAREALVHLYKNYCTEDGYLKVVFKNRYGEKHITRIEVYIDYTTAFSPLLVINYPYLQIPK